MRIFLLLIACTWAFIPSLTAADNTFLDYQNYNHGYCPDCNCSPCECAGGCPAAPGVPGSTCPPPNPCNPAPVCATECGLNLWLLGGVLVVIATAAVFIVGSNNGSAPSHAASP